MTVAWILYVLLVGTLLACAALAVDGILRRTALPARWVWLAALGGIVALAMLAPRREFATQSLEIPGNKVVTTSVVLPSTTSFDLMNTIANARRAIETTVSFVLGAAEVRVPAALELPLVIIWCLLSAAVLSVLVIVSRRLNHARRTWPVHEVHGTSVRIAVATGPAVIGFARPEIVVPSWLFARSVDEQRLVIVHEREHMAARDQLLLAGGWLAAVLLPWHPAVWWSLSRMRLAIELDCDARVLDGGVQPRPYGSLLIDIAGQCAGHRVGALALADRTSHLERRLLAMKPSRTRFTPLRTGALGAIAFLAVLVACEARLPTSAEVEKMDVAGAERAAVLTKMLEEKKQHDRAYTIDGVAVSEEVAHKLAAGKIATIEVSKNKLRDEIRVTTLAAAQEFKQAAEGMKDPQALRMTYENRAIGREPLEERASVKLQPSKREFNGVVIIDGVTMTGRALAELREDDIVSVEVVKGVAATGLSADPAAANGIIKVTTKRGKQ